MADRPNIFWFVSEDCPPHGPLADGLAAMPTLERLVREGITFTRAFSTAPVCAPSRFSLLTGRYPQSHAPAQQMSANAHLRDGITTYPEAVRAAGYYASNNFKTHYNCDIDPDAIWDDCSPRGHWRDRPAGVPFLAVVNDLVTHESILFGDLEVTRVTPEMVTVPAYLPDTPEQRSDLARYVTAVERMDAHFGEWIAQLEEDGLLDDTIIVYSSDHGGVGPWSKRFCYDDGLRIPLVVRVPERWRTAGMPAPGARVERAVDAIDIPPTLLALLGVTIPETMHGRPLFAPDPTGYAFGGRDRMDERWDLVRTVRDERYRYVRNYSPHRPHGQILGSAWRAAGYRSWEEEHRSGRLDDLSERFWRCKPAEELYDMRIDPAHAHDLIGDPAHVAAHVRLSAVLDEQMLAIGDEGFAPEGSETERMLGAGDRSAYPLQRILDLTRAAIGRDRDGLPRLLDELDDPLEVIRFWAAQGIVMLQARAAPALPRLREAVAGERSPHVAVALAEAIAVAGAASEAVALLAPRLAPGTRPQVRLLAYNALRAAGPAARDLLPVIARAWSDDDEYVRGAARALALELGDGRLPDAPLFDDELFAIAKAARRA